MCALVPLQCDSVLQTKKLLKSCIYLIHALIHTLRACSSCPEIVRVAHSLCSGHTYLSSRAHTHKHTLTLTHTHTHTHTYTHTHSHTHTHTHTHKQTHTHSLSQPAFQLPSGCARRLQSLLEATLSDGGRTQLSASNTTIDNTSLNGSSSIGGGSSMVLAASDLVDALWGLDVLGQRPSDEQLNRLVILGTVGEEQAAVVGEIVVGEFCRLPVLQAQFCRLPTFCRLPRFAGPVLQAPTFCRRSFAGSHVLQAPTFCLALV